MTGEGERVVRYGSLNSGGHTWTVSEWAAVRALAADVVRRAFEYAKDNAVPGWEDYPEVGEFDWAEVLDVAESMVPEADPEKREAAVALLATRAEPNA